MPQERLCLESQNVRVLIGRPLRVRRLRNHLAMIVVWTAILLGAVHQTQATPIELPYFDATAHTVGFHLELLSPEDYFAQQGHVFYEASFDLTSTGFGDIGYFQFYWNGYFLLDLQDHSAFGPRHFSFSNLPPALGLQFQAFPVSSSPFTFTNISVRRTTNAVPETGSNAVLLAMGLAGLGAFWYWRRPSGDKI